MTHRAQVPSYQQGFTLLELLLALSIFAVASAIVIPRVSGARDSAVVQASAQKLAAALKATRAASIKASEARGLVIDLGAAQYWSDGVQRVTKLPRGVSVDLKVPGASSAKSRAVIRFRPDGSATEAEIRFTKGRRSAVIAVDWLTGATRVVRG